MPGVSRHHERVVSFAARQLLDVVSPSNFPWTNPEVLEATAEQRGANLARGANLLAERLAAPAHRRPPRRAPRHSCPAGRWRSRRARWCSAIT